MNLEFVCQTGPLILNRCFPTFYNRCGQHDLSRFYQEVSRDVVNHKNSLHRALQLTFPQLESLFSNTYWTIVNHFACPSRVLKLSATELRSFILHSTNKNISIDRATHITEKLLTLAKKA
ncbi:hypothetical protein HUK45_09215 [Limosilactobacillus sp. c9Ua_26_M]|uniref:Transposase n=1 Tax=Limosilactobacillus urinaemulieris TaxID=2742600 RepID=A0ABR8ZM40_9LACO|nr:hypothetical protein [Limosilactobacillus urinaemulieris]MBD8086362.1 hypothetical protein [Limosilactobacillus urinaemulieris]